MVKVADDTAPSVSASGGGGSPLGVQASPNAFGAQVGGAIEKVGQEGENLATKFTGMINETAANQAETGYIEQAGKLTGKFKSLEGLEAQAAIPQYEQDMTSLRQSIRSSLPGGAARMFDANTNRHESYALSDAYAYGATQVKKATLDSNNAVAETAISQAGSPTIAGDDQRFGGVIGDIHHSVQSMMELQGYGQYVTADKDGNATFADSPEGKQAQKVYQSELDKRTGMAWENRIHSLADQNVETAYNTFTKNRDQIPGEAQVKLDAFLTPKVRDYQARGDADTILNKHEQEYKDTITGGSTSGSNANNLGNVKTAAGAAGGTADFVHPATPVDGVILTANNLRKNYTGLTLSQIGAKWAPSSENNTNDWVSNVSKASGIAPGATPNLNDPAQLKSLLTGIATAEKSPKDRALFTSEVLDQGVQGAIAGKQPSSAVGPFQPKKIESTGLVPSQADYYRTNYESIVKEARDTAQLKHPDDPAYADTAASKVEQRMSIAIKGQELSYKADNDTVMKAFNGDFSKGARPTSVEQLRASSPETAAAWDRLTVNNPIAANAVENRILTTNAKGSDKDAREYGSGFYKLFQAVHSDPTSPDHIHDVTQLYSHIGESGDLTMAGMEKLNNEINDKGTPEGSAEADMKKQFFSNAKAEISGKNDTLGISDKKGEEQNLKFMAQAFTLIKKLKADGKTAVQIYNPDSPDYVGKLIPAFKRPLNVQLQDINRDAAGLDATPGKQVRTPAVVLAEARGTTDPTKRAALKAELIRMGAIRDDTKVQVSVPRPQ